MARWSRRTKKYYRVKIKSMRLQGFVFPVNQMGSSSESCKYNLNQSTTDNNEIDLEQQLVLGQCDSMVELCWEGPTSIKDKKNKLGGRGGGGFNLLPFPMWSKSHQHKIRNDVSTAAKIFRAGEEIIQWDDDEFENTCSFTAINDSRDPVCFDQWPITFRLVLSNGGGGQSAGKKKRRDVVAEATVDLSDVLLLLLKMENQKQQELELETEHMVPLELIQLEPDAAHHDGSGSCFANAAAASQPTIATLSMSISFTEETTDSSSSSSRSHSRSTSTESLDIDRFQEYHKHHTSSSIMRKAKSLAGKRKKKKGRQTISSSSSFKPVTAEQGKSPSAASSETESTDDKKSSGGGFNRIWRRKSDSFKRAKTLTGEKQDPQPSGKPSSSHPQQQTEFIRNTPGVWLEKELTSRDGRTILESKLFFASFDQRGQQAAGESACAAIVAVFSHWLQSNPSNLLPTGTEFDHLIIQGSTEWRKLCGDESSREDFPDSHFDLETVIRAELRPVTILQDRSHIGFFSPEKFDFLREARSFDDIWDEINGNGDAGVYIVSWNDHFFVLKVDGEICYVMDSLGERLYEGCDQAYILKFDESTVMYEKKVKEVAKSDNKGSTKKDNGEDEEVAVVCKGKECCREYIKRFLAALTVRDLQEREEKGNPASIFALHQRLQIEFHYSTPSVFASPDKQIPIN